ncbi:MAG TPA: TIGR03936 family radical SAM-associated protein [Magnetospirillaceae bacterium]|nr:TIGR03936 family radical SAM-associated protein [Magnetospirillaceae bacterium]
MRVLGKRLAAVEKPARYLGGEQGAVRKDGDLLTVAICFPDLYEIGMSNNAIRILYRGLNALPGVRCERVFAPARDFEALLRETATPLYTLETGIPLREVDILAFTVGYELSATGILTVLDLGWIPLEASGRGGDHPVVIAGGPAVSNPLPLSRFIDAVWIGEAEAGFFELIDGLSRPRTGRMGRSGMLSRFRAEPAFWMPGKKAVRAVDEFFSERSRAGSFPRPSIKPVQDHAAVEIMRGCPNGCRFCHAGYYYRPQRVRDPARIFEEVESLVQECGYREISLSSLSSGDYPGIDVLVRELNSRWAGQRVSFQLPSLKVESFSLHVIEELTRTRRSGLTFAVETPEEAWQRSINKSASLDKILSILREAGRHGYKLAKFYFMIGLPLPDTGISESDSLIRFIRGLLEGCSLQLNVNIGTFIPKAHTPYQWCLQLDEEESYRRIRSIRETFRSERRIRIAYHTPLVSYIEGILSRGDEGAGDIVMAAWKAGSRLDAWEDLMDKEIWRKVLDQASMAVVQQAIHGRDVNAPLPWDDVSVGTQKQYFVEEYARSLTGTPTSACTEECAEPCGVCAGSRGVVRNIIHSNKLPGSAPGDASIRSIRSLNGHGFRLVVRYSKAGASAFLPHHSIIECFYRAVQLSGLPFTYTEGFNPLPRLEIENPIPLGMPSLEDYFSIRLYDEPEIDSVVFNLNRHLPDLLQADAVKLYRLRGGPRDRSLSSLCWGSEYLLYSDNAEHASVITGLLTDSRLEGSFALYDTAAGYICLRLRAAGVRELGFGALYEKVFGEPYARSRFAVQRIRQWADSGSGPVSFFNALDAIYA